jgi:antitoxin MazE
MQTTIFKAGNSCGIRIPKTVLDTLNLREKDTIELTVRGTEIVLRRALPSTPDELWGKCNPDDYPQQEITWGDNVGREALYW